MRNAAQYLLTLAALSSTPAFATDARVTSWGNSGVSFEQYRRDAVECGRQGYYLDVSDTEAAHVFREASHKLDSNDTDLAAAAMAGDRDRTMNIVASSSRIVEGTRPQKRLREVRDLLAETVAACLTGRGYRRFQLTSAQQARLHRLPVGSPERHSYLYSLASDARVLGAQAI